MRAAVETIKRSPAISNGRACARLGL